jgi:hypothetical protein
MSRPGQPGFTTGAAMMSASMRWSGLLSSRYSYDEGGHSLAGCRALHLLLDVVQILEPIHESLSAHTILASEPMKKLVI